ncbi:hypothetical protein LINGRAHAP2_LOCUS32609 [Linum grandiflorum]
MPAETKLPTGKDTSVVVDIDAAAGQEVSQGRPEVRGLWELVGFGVRGCGD